MIRLSDLAEVSNNSHLTQSVHHTLTEKLSPAEQEEFRRWLQLVQTTGQINVNNAKRKW